MKDLDKISEGARITFDFVAGIISLVAGTLVTFLFFVAWATLGLQAPVVGGYILFGLLPLGMGITLIKRGRDRKAIFKRKLLRDAVRKIALRKGGKVKPGDLINTLGYTSSEAIQALRTLTAEDPDNIDLQLDYDTGDIYFEFQDIIRDTQGNASYKGVISESPTWTDTALNVAKRVDQILTLFNTYRECRRQLMSQSALNGKLEEYKSKAQQLQEEIERIRRTI
jgi:hypothetical protein